MHKKKRGVFVLGIKTGIDAELVKPLMEGKEKTRMSGEVKGIPAVEYTLSKTERGIEITLPPLTRRQEQEIMDTHKKDFLEQMVTLKLPPSKRNKVMQTIKERKKADLRRMSYQELDGTATSIQIGKEIVEKELKKAEKEKNTASVKMCKRFITWLDTYRNLIDSEATRRRNIGEKESKKIIRELTPKQAGPTPEQVQLKSAESTIVEWERRKTAGIATEEEEVKVVRDIARKHPELTQEMIDLINKRTRVGDLIPYIIKEIRPLTKKEKKAFKIND